MPGDRAVANTSVPVASTRVLSKVWSTRISSKGTLCSWLHLTPEADSVEKAKSSHSFSALGYVSISGLTCQEHCMWNEKPYSLLLTHFLFLKAQVTIVIEGLQGRRGRSTKVSNVEVVCYTRALRTWV